MVVVKKMNFPFLKIENKRLMFVKMIREIL